VTDDSEGLTISRVRCESDAWPFAGDIALFEARRAIGQLTRSFYALYLLADQRPSVPALYLGSAKVVSETLNDVTADLVAEARARGASWAEIGKALEVGATAAQKRFGKGISPRRLEDRKFEAFAVRHASEASAGPYAGPKELLEELEGTTPADRLRYAVELFVGIDSLLAAAERELKKASPNGDELIRLMWTVKDKVIRVIETVISDPAQWQAVPTWSGRAVNPDAANYHCPTAYWYFAMRQLCLATILIVGMFDPTVDFNRHLEYFMWIRHVIRQIMLVLGRLDIEFPQNSREADAP
jgi:hypothetical protein